MPENQERVRKLGWGRRSFALDWSSKFAEAVSDQLRTPEYAVEAGKRIAEQALRKRPRDSKCIRNSEKSTERDNNAVAFKAQLDGGAKIASGWDDSQTEQPVPGVAPR